MDPDTQPARQRRRRSSTRSPPPRSVCPTSAGTSSTPPPTSSKARPTSCSTAPIHADTPPAAASTPRRRRRPDHPTRTSPDPVGGQPMADPVISDHHGVIAFSRRHRSRSAICRVEPAGPDDTDRPGHVDRLQMSGHSGGRSRRPLPDVDTTTGHRCDVLRTGCDTCRSPRRRRSGWLWKGSRIWSATAEHLGRGCSRTTPPNRLSPSFLDGEDDPSGDRAGSCVDRRGVRRFAADPVDVRRRNADPGVSEDHGLRPECRSAAA